ncbi:MAG: outer membrane beta-barrel family protein [Bacteroidota bacterium]
MKNLCLLGVLAMLCAFTAIAMPANYQIKGQILAETGQQALEYATVSAFQDTLLIDGTITDQAGLFSLNLEEGNYSLRIEFIGFASKEMEIELNENLDLGKIELSNDGIDLDAVEVTAEQSQFNLRLDKKVFNVGKDLLSTGGSATEVLDNVPSVTVEPSGTVSLRGNAGVTILVNGKPSALAQNDALSTIPASSIERVEVITNPSARYESAGNAGIINIVLKKERRKGFNGRASISAGIPADSRPTFNFNFRRDKINFFGNIGARYANFIGRSDMNRTSTIDGVTSSFEADSDQDRNDKAVFGFLGMDYFITDEQTITASYSNYSVINTDQAITDFLFRDGSSQLTETWNQVFDYREPESYNQLDISYAKTFSNDENKKWNITFQHDFWFNDETEEIRITESFPTMSERLNLRTNTIESSRDYLLQTDYQMGLGENGTLELGLRAETRIIKSDFIAENRENDIWQIYQGFDNELDYYERIGGAYVQYGQRFEKFSYLLGLRSEYTYIKVDLLDEIEDVEKTYTRFFPTVNTSYQLTEATGAQLSYSRRIRRPQFWQLNPFAGLSDPNEIFQGNPDLDPAYTNRVELNLVQNWEKVRLNPAIYYSATEEYFGFSFEPRADGVVIQQPINLELEQQYGVELIASYRPMDMLSFNGEINWFGYDQKGQFKDQNFDFRASTWTSRLSMQYRFLKTFSFQTRWNYQAAYEDALVDRKAVQFTDFALSKQFFNEQLTATLNVRNAFDSRWYRSTTTLANLVQGDNRAWNVRRYQLTLTYQFSQGERGRLRNMRGSIR